MIPLTPFGKRVVILLLGLAMLLIGGLGAHKIGVDGKTLIDAGMRLLQEAEPTSEPSPVQPTPVATPSLPSPV